LIAMKKAPTGTQMPLRPPLRPNVKMLATRILQARVHGLLTGTTRSAECHAAKIATTQTTAASRFRSDHGHGPTITLTEHIMPEPSGRRLVGEWHRTYGTPSGSSGR
jgi:hypothetical protein